MTELKLGKHDVIAIKHKGKDAKFRAILREHAPMYGHPDLNSTLKIEIEDLRDLDEFINILIQYRKRFDIDSIFKYEEIK